MALFSSDRERRLWLWTLAVMVAIYSTLGVTPTLTAILREHGLLEASFALGMVLIGAAIVTQGVKIRPGGAEIAVVLGVMAVYLLVFVRIEAPPEERTHLIEYGVVAVDEVGPWRGRSGHWKGPSAVGGVAPKLK